MKHAKHTLKQARTMMAAAHNPALAKRVGIPRKVAKEYVAAKKGTALLSKAAKSRG